MTTLAERPNTALLVIDVQNDVMSGTHNRDAVIAPVHHHGAIVRGHDATLVADAHTTEDLSEWGAPTPDKVIDHTNLYWQNHAAPGRHAWTVATGSVTFG